MSKERIRTRTPVSHIQHYLTEQSQSGLTIEAYCRRHHLALSTFQYWKRNHVQFHSNTTQNPQQESAVLFRPLGSIGVSDSSFRYHVKTGVVEIPQQFNPASLRQLLDCLAAVWCVEQSEC